MGGILRGARIAGVDLGQLRARHPRERTHPFDPDVMMMATVHGDDGGHLAAVKGAPEAVIAAASHAAVTPDDDEPLDDQARASWRERVAALASEGLRVLAVADARMGSTDAEPYATLRLVGLVGLLDPARSDVRGAIEQCRSAGIRVVMVTGDQPETGLAIARHVGIATDDDRAMRGDELRDARQLTPEERERAASTVVFARVTPEQKLNLVEIAQGRGETVAMTGDGVNDAPALKKADIGIAMGKRGTEAARQASDMILQDDAFSSIVAAIHQGRIIFANIRASVMFMLCTNVAEILAVTAASLVNAPLPLHPLQILFLNVVTDVFPALALGVGKGGPHVMRRPPRPAAEAILTRGHWLGIGGWSVVIATSVLGALAYALIALELDAAAAVTISFLTLAFGKLWFVFNLRERRDGLLNNRITRNPWIWAAIALCSVLLLAAVYWPWLAGLLQTRPLDAAAWATVLTASAIPAAAGVALHILRRDRSAGGDRSDDRSAPVAAGDTV